MMQRARGVLIDLWRRHGDRLWRYLLVGATGTLVNFVVLKLVWPALHQNPSLADGVASEVAILTNYLLNTRFTFRTRPQWRTLLQYNLVLAGGSLLQVGVFTVLVDLGVYYLLANLLAIPFNTAVGFVLSQWWVFRPSGDADQPSSNALMSLPHERDPLQDDPRTVVGSADRRR
jgi:dolichol-phosphate mannosyltransferase